MESDFVGRNRLFTNGTNQLNMTKGEGDSGFIDLNQTANFQQSLGLNNPCNTSFN